MNDEWVYSQQLVAESIQRSSSTSGNLSVVFSFTNGILQRDGFQHESDGEPDLKFHSCFFIGDGLLRR